MWLGIIVRTKFYVWAGHPGRRIPPPPVSFSCIPFIGQRGTALLSWLLVMDGLVFPLGDRFPSYSVEPNQSLGSHQFGCLCLELLWGQTRIAEP